MTFVFFFHVISVCRWRRSSTLVKSAAGNQQLLHISSANYPGTCNHETQTQKKHVLFYIPNEAYLYYDFLRKSEQKQVF